MDWKTFVTAVFVISILAFVVLIIKYSFFTSNTSYKSVIKGHWVIKSNIVAKILYFSLLSSWGLMILFNEPWIKRRKNIGQVRCYDTSDPLCINGFLHVTDTEFFIIVTFALCIILCGILIILKRDTIIISKNSITQECGLRPFIFTKTLYFNDKIYIDTFRNGYTDYIIVKSLKSNTNTRIALVFYTKKDIEFIKELIDNRNKEFNKRADAVTDEQ